MEFVKSEKKHEAPYVVVQTRYALAVKNYGSGDNPTEYYPIMEDGTAIVRKESVQGFAVLEGNYGTIDRSGYEKIPCIYDSIKPINSKLFIVGKNYTEGGFSGDDFSFPKQMYGIVDDKGEIVSPISSRWISVQDNEIIIQQFDGTRLSIDINGQHSKNR